MECLDDYRIGKRIGKASLEAKVYNSCCDEKHIDIENCKYVTKIVTFDRYNTPQNFMNEIELQLKVSKINLAPRIVKIDRTEKEGSIVMEKFKYTLKDLLLDICNIENNTLVEEIAIKTANLLNEVHKIGILHNDAHLYNFMLDENGSIKLIDFGKSTQLDSITKKMAKEDYYWITDYLLVTDEHKDVKCINFFANKVAEQRDINLTHFDIPQPPPFFDMPPPPFDEEIVINHYYPPPSYDFKNRKSPKRKSPKRKSPKRKSPKRKSPKRKSPKRKSPKRKSPKYKRIQVKK